MSMELRSPRDIAFRQVIRGARVERGWDAKPLSLRMQRADNFISKIETGEREMGIREFDEWCTILAFTPQEIYDRVDAYKEAEKPPQTEQLEKSGQVE